MEGVACVKKKHFQKRHLAAVWILKHREVVVQFSRVCTADRFWVSAYSKTQYIR